MSFTKATAIVIYAPMGDVDTSAPVHPAARYSEILECKNGNAKAEKYLVWRLLEHAVKNYTNLDFANLQFTKTDTGRVDVPKTVEGGRCEITTDTGDIKITVD